MAFFSCIILYQLIGISNVAAYETSFVRESASISVMNSSSIPYFIKITNGVCSDSLTTYVSGAGLNYYLNSEYWLPTNNLLGTSSRTFTNNNCSYNGMWNKIITSNVSFKSRFYASFSANYLDMFIKDNITCIADYISMTNNGFYNGNTNLNLPYTYYISLFKNESVLCFTPKTFYQIPTGISHYGSYYWEDVFIYPFNSGLGNIDINVTNDGTNPKTWYYYKANDIGSPTSIGTGSFSKHFILTANTDYVLYGYKHFGNTFCTGAPCSVSIPNVIIDIDTRSPNIECNDYGECMNGTKERLCHDLNSFIPDYLEFESCYTLPEKSVNIGFENTTSVKVWYSYPTWWLPIVNCDASFILDRKDVEYPSDWETFWDTNPYIIDNATTLSAYIFDTLKVVNDESSSGSKSLKMWYNPPSKFLPTCSDYLTWNWRTCDVLPNGNYSIGHESNVIKNINESFMIGKNISFTYPNITLSFDIKKCDKPEKQYSGDLVTFGNLSLLSCGDGYYTFDKNLHDVEETTISFSIYDYNTTSYIATHFLKTDKTSWERNEIILHGLNTTHLYRFMIGTYVNNLVDTGTYCAYIDDVEINAYTGAVLPTAYCDDEHNYYDLISLSENSYTFKKYLNDVRCFSSDFTTTIENCGSKCMCIKTATDYLTYYVGDNSTGYCEINEISNSEYCVNYCKNENIKSADETIQDLLDSSGIGWASGFFSPFFLIIIVVIAIAVICAYFLESWEVFVAILITEILIISYLWIEFAFIGIIIVAVLALYLAKLITRN